MSVLQVNNSTNSTKDEEQSAVAFPHHLYSHVSKASVSPPQLHSAHNQSFDHRWDSKDFCSQHLTVLLFFFLQAEGKLAFTVHILREISALIEEDYSSSSWQETTVENFLNVVNKQADELHSCVSSLSFPYDYISFITILVANILQKM